MLWRITNSSHEKVSTTTDERLGLTLAVGSVGCLKNVIGESDDINTEALNQYAGGRQLYREAEVAFESAMVDFVSDRWTQAVPEFAHARSQYSKSLQYFTNASEMDLPQNAKKLADLAFRRTDLMVKAAKYFAASASGYGFGSLDQVDRNYKQATTYHNQAQSIPSPVTVEQFQDALQQG